MSFVDVIKLFLIGFEINLFKILNEMYLLIFDKLRTNTDKTDTAYVRSLFAMCLSSQRALHASNTIDSFDL